MSRKRSKLPGGYPELYLARHCTTRWNTERRIQGSKDLPLSETGKTEAAALLPRLSAYGFDRIYASPYQRAVQTARIYADHLDIPLNLHPGLSELNHGRWEGHVIDTLLASPESGYGRWLENPMGTPIPDGTETVIEAQNRVADAVADIANANGNRTVLVVLHKHIRALLQCRLQQAAIAAFGGLIDEGVAPTRIPEDQITGICRPD